MNRRLYDRGDLARHISYVDQDIHFISDTILHNLTMGCANIGEEGIATACKDAMIYEHILSLRNGFETMLDDNGYRMSGGERQRLELARALCRFPSLLILDEATGSLDMELEIQVLENIRRRGCAVVLVTHRRSAMLVCDHIYAIKRGVLTKSEVQ